MVVGPGRARGGGQNNVVGHGGNGYARREANRALARIEENRHDDEVSQEADDGEDVDPSMMVKISDKVQDELDDPLDDAQCAYN